MYCAECSKKIDNDSNFCVYCGNEVKKNRKNDNDEISHTDRGIIIPASQGRRLLNLLIDLTAYTVLYIIIFIIIDSFGYALTPNEQYAVTILTFLGYYTLTEFAYSKSLGKLVTRTKVIHRSGDELTFNQAFWRSVTRLIPFEILSHGSNHPIGWHDKISRTIVIKDK